MSSEISGVSRYAAVVSIDALREQAFSHHESGELDAGERAYREVLRQAPGDLDIVHALGLLTAQTGRFGEAVELLARVLRGRQTAAAHADLGNALCGLSRFEEAVRSYWDTVFDAVRRELQARLRALNF
jgi:Flp pilus assembly protein TadD